MRLWGWIWNSGWISQASLKKALDDAMDATAKAEEANAGEANLTLTLALALTLALTLTLTLSLTLTQGVRRSVDSWG